MITATVPTKLSGGPGGAETLEATIEEPRGGINLLVNNAGDMAPAVTFSPAGSSFAGER